MTSPMRRAPRSPAPLRWHVLAEWAVVLVSLLSRTAVWTAAFLVFWAAVPALFGWSNTTVMSGSMEPSIRVGDVVSAMPVGEHEVTEGRVVLADDPDHAGRLRLHRVSRVVGDGVFELKGDAVPQPDRSHVSMDAIRGIGVIRVPWAGLPVVWLAGSRLDLLPGAVAALAGLGLLSRCDRRLRGDPFPCGWCGAPSLTGVLGTHLEQRSGAVGRRDVVAIALVTTLFVSCVGTAWSGFDDTTTTATDLGTADRYSCFVTPLDSPEIAYAFDETGGEDVQDVSGHGLTANMQPGVTRVDGGCADSPYALFDGTKSGVTPNYSARPAPGSFSIETWFTTTTAQGKLVGFGDRAGGASKTFDRHLYVNSGGALSFGWATKRGRSVITTPSPVTDGAWHHVVATLSPDGGALYLDGVLIGTDPDPAGDQYEGFWRIGYDKMQINWPKSPKSGAFVGGLDGVAVYDHVLNAEQAAAHWAAGR